jgi:DNA invertase Pin-like site-specific DNA recombinase
LAIATSCPIQSPYETQKTQYPWGFKPHFPLVSSTRFPDEPDFIAVDFPQANRLTIHILAAVAENEAKMISDRTRAALAAAKERGTVLGGFRGRAGSCTDLAKARAMRTAKADSRAIDLAPTIQKLRSEGQHSLRSIAARLNEQGITAPRGGKWSAAQIRPVLRRIAVAAT